MPPKSFLLHFHSLNFYGRASDYHITFAHKSTTRATVLAGNHESWSQSTSVTTARDAWVVYA